MTHNTHIIVVTFDFELNCFGSSVLVMLNREIERREQGTGNREKILIF